VDAEQLVIDQALDEIGYTPSGAQHAEVHAPRRRELASLPRANDQQRRRRDEQPRGGVNNPSTSVLATDPATVSSARRRSRLPAAGRRRSSGLLAVGRAEWEGVGESGLLEDAVHVRRTASQLELDSSSLRLRVESDDHSQTGGVDEMEPVEVEVDSSQAGRLDCPLERGLDGEGRLHVEIAAQRRDDGVGARGQLDGSRVAGRHVAL
jgi:hypothetical protein